MKNLTTETIALSTREQAAERALLDQFARFWASHADTPLRDTYDLFIGSTPLAADSAFEEVSTDGVHGWWVHPAGRDTGARPASAVLYIHGGGHVLGSSAAYRGFASQIATRTRMPVFVLEYPLAPESPFPAGQEAALAAARWLARRGVERLAVVGDSAGGGLSLSVIASMVTMDDVPAVAAGVAFSPWTDLSLSGASMTDPAVHDALLSREYLADCAAKVLRATPARDPRASPLFGPMAGLPPLYLQVGSDELLLDDAKRYAQRAAEQGVDVRLDIWQGLHHVFQLNVAELESARFALDRAAGFVVAHLGG